MTYQLLQGDARHIPLADESVDCVVTSPPYWKLRDYGVSGQLGLEPTPDEYVAHMVEVFREVKRVLKPTGVCWLNIGDSYVGSGNGSGDYREKTGLGAAPTTKYKGQKPGMVDGLKPKDLVGIPWRVAFALQADGWWLRSDIIWHKPNPMPESVTDRPTKAHEYVFLLTKSGRYWYDAEAIKEPVAESTIGRGPVDFGGAKGREYKPERGDPNFRNGSEQWGRRFDYTESCKNGRNSRSVWTICTTPYRGAHYATMAPKLAERCILAGCPLQVCAKCGKPWERVVERQADRIGTSMERPKARGAVDQGAGGYGTSTSTLSIGGRGGGGAWQDHGTKITTLGFRPTCECNAETVPGIVFDPFVGSGTTVAVAVKLGRHGIGLDLSAKYLKENASVRVAQTQPALIGAWGAR